MIHAIAEIEDTDKAREALTTAHADFLRAGGVLSAAEWASLQPWERECMAIAGDDVARERAALACVAMRDGPGAVLAPVDDGETLVRENLRAAVEEAIHGD